LNQKVASLLLFLIERPILNCNNFKELVQEVWKEDTYSIFSKDGVWQVFWVGIGFAKGCRKY
jgi:hypothetical protein